MIQKKIEMDKELEEERLRKLKDMELEEKILLEKKKGEELLEKIKVLRDNIY